MNQLFIFVEKILNTLFHRNFHKYKLD